MRTSNTSYELMVREFNNKHGHYMAAQSTTEIPDEVKGLRIKLIEEECEELIQKGILANNLDEIADGCVDLIYVVVGCMMAYGIPADRVFREVHRSNMTKDAVKVEQGQKYGSKTPKGPNFVPPDIKTILQHPERYTMLEVRG
jgi:predicted HAD superfamily Cof-like phosphohydrolase